MFFSFFKGFTCYANTSTLGRTLLMPFSLESSVVQTPT